MLLSTIEHYTPIVAEIIEQAQTQGMSTEQHIAPVLAKLEVSLQYLQAKHNELYPRNGEDILFVTQFNRDRKGLKARDEIMKARSKLAVYERTLRHYLSEKPAMLCPPPPPYRSPSPTFDAESEVEIKREVPQPKRGTKNQDTDSRSSETKLARDRKWRSANDSKLKSIAPAPLPLRKYSFKFNRVGLLLLLVIAVMVAFKAGSLLWIVIWLMITAQRSISKGRV